MGWREWQMYHFIWLCASYLTSFQICRDMILDWILYHHERIDGNGYYKVKEEDIPIPARIIAIADTYSAITMRRSYKQPRTHEDAVKIISEVAGTQLDEDLVTIFLTIPREELEKCIPTQVRYWISTNYRITAICKNTRIAALKG